MKLFWIIMGAGILFGVGSFNIKNSIRRGFLNNIGDGLDVYTRESI